MNIITRESLFEYQVKELIGKFKDDWGIEETGNELLEKIWKDKHLASELGKSFLESISNFGLEL